MKRFLFCLIPILVFMFGISSYASERIGTITYPWATREFTVDYDASNCFPFAYLSSGNSYYYGVLYLGQGDGLSHIMSNEINNSTYFAIYRSYSTFPSPISNVTFSPEFYVFNSFNEFRSWADTFTAESYDSSLTLNPKFLYGLNFIKLFLGKSSLVDTVTVTIDRIFNDGRPSETVFTNDYTQDNPYIEFWDDFDFPVEDIPHISYQMKLVPKDSNGNYGNTYNMDFRLRYNDISGVWKYDIDIPTVTHGGGGHERVPIEGINEYTSTVINPTDNTIVTPPRTFYSPSVSNTYIENNDNSTEIYNYITNNYITESPNPIYSNTEPLYDPSIEFPSLTDMLSVLKQAFSLLKQMFESIKDLFINFFQYFMFLPSWFIVSLSTLATISVGIAIWLFVKNLIL